LKLLLLKPKKSREKYKEFPYFSFSATELINFAS